MSDSINNPILKGFNPDPSICRVGDDYYIATSTFEWYPGVQIHHSRDLVNWRLLTRPLDRASLLDIRGAPDSCGVWAPCLTHADGLFWLIYTRVNRFDGNFKDTHNYLTTCEHIDGDWSDPVYLNSRGFDPSLFHDEDGRKWYLSMIWDHRPDRTFFAGIFLQEYSVDQRRLVGESHTIFTGSESGFTEGPHLYQRDGYYYLLTAEGGTGYDHAMTMARAETITGPYEVDPGGHFITARDCPESPLQRCGHGDWVETPDGKTYAVHLCSRPLSPENHRSPMGRESAIELVAWDEAGWLRNLVGSSGPAESVPAPDLPECPWPAPGERCEFQAGALPIDFQWLRTPEPGYLFSLEARPGFLRLYGRESLGSLFYSSLVARRQQAFSFEATTELEFSPEHFQQQAGLVCYYNSHKFHYLFLSRDEEHGRHLGIMSCEGDPSLKTVYPLQQAPVRLPDDGPLQLRASVCREQLQFSWSPDGEQWSRVGEVLDYSLLCDEVGKGEGANFTGAFVGMCCQDVAGTAIPADYRFFEYRETTP
ncbi:MAG: glycoside hydrolase family 43 protein [Halieaceae bacterium]